MHHSSAPVGWGVSVEDVEDDLSKHEPTESERARTVLCNNRSAVLSVVVGDPTPAPIGFAVPYAVDDQGFPLVCIRPGIEKAIRLRHGMQVCFAVAETPLTAASSGTPGGISLLAAATVLAVGTELDNALHTLARTQPAEASAIKRNAAKLVRLTPSVVLVSSSSGDVVRVDVAEYSAASSDPLAAVAPGLVAHLAADEGGSLVLLCRAYGGLHDTKSAELVGIDQYGMDLLATGMNGRRNVRIAFSHQVSSPDDVRRELTSMARGARFKLGSG